MGLSEPLAKLSLRTLIAAIGSGQDRSPPRWRTRRSSCAIVEASPVEGIGVSQRLCSPVGSDRLRNVVSRGAPPVPPHLLLAVLHLGHQRVVGPAGQADIARAVVLFKELDDPTSSGRCPAPPAGSDRRSSTAPFAPRARGPGSLRIPAGTSSRGLSSATISSICRLDLWVARFRRACRFPAVRWGASKAMPLR